jgi:hypothetical protein
MGSGAVIYVPSFIKIDSGAQKLIGGYTDTQTTNKHTHTHGQQRGLISLLYFIKRKKVGYARDLYHLGQAGNNAEEAIAACSV